MFGIAYSEKSILQISTFPKDFSLQTYSADAVVNSGELLNFNTGEESESFFQLPRGAKQLANQEFEDFSRC